MTLAQVLSEDWANDSKAILLSSLKSMQIIHYLFINNWMLTKYNFD